MWGLDDAATAAIITGAASTAASGISAATAGKTNARGSRLAHRQHEWAVQDAKMQREWALEDWNRNAEYNSPAAVLQRYADAGISPMAAINEGVGTQAPQTASPNAVAMPSAPHFVNPLGDMPQIMNAASGVINSIYQNRRAIAEVENIQTDTEKKLQETEILRSQAKYADQLNEGQVNFLGARIDLTKAQTKESQEQVKLIAKTIAEKEQQIINLKQICEERSVDISLKQFELYARKINLPLQRKLMCSQIILNMQHAATVKALRPLQIVGQKASNRNANLDADMKQAYYSGGSKNSFWYRNQNADTVFKENQADKANYEAQITKGQVKSDFLYAYDRGIDSVAKTVDAFSGVVKGFMMYQMGKSQMMPKSSPNPPKNTTPRSAMSADEARAFDAAQQRANNASWNVGINLGM